MSCKEWMPTTRAVRSISSSTLVYSREDKCGVERQQGSEKTQRRTKGVRMLLVSNIVVRYEKLHIECVRVRANTRDLS